MVFISYGNCRMVFTWAAQFRGTCSWPGTADSCNNRTVALHLFAAMTAHSGVCGGRPPSASTRVRCEAERWQMAFPFLSRSKFEDNPFSTIEWINWNQTQSRLIALLVIDVLFVWRFNNIVNSWQACYLYSTAVEWELKWKKWLSEWGKPHGPPPPSQAARKEQYI
jgi:hypothetical protein